MPGLRFDSAVPVAAQLTDFSCSVGATFWCLRSLSVDLQQEDLQNIMVPSLVSPDLGLLDGSGATIARFLRDRFGLMANNLSPISFDQLAARAGQQPIAVGGSRWFVGADGSVIGHWVAVRSFDGAQLLLANPGGTGPRFGQQALDRGAFEQRAPFSAVIIDAAGGTSGPTRLAFRVGNTGGDGANLRAEPSTTGGVLRSLAEGSPVSGAEHAWRSLTDASGAQGWVANEYLRAADGHFVVANTGGTGANLRSKPDGAADVVKLLAEGAALTGEQHAWRQVSDGSGVSGWVADEFLVATT